MSSTKAFKDGLVELTGRIRQIDAAKDVESRRWRQKLRQRFDDLQPCAEMDDKTTAEWSSASRILQKENRQPEIMALPQQDTNLPMDCCWSKFVWRECYNSYEEKVVPSSTQEDIRVNGLIGPAGVGKTGFLPYMQTQYACHERY